MYKFIRNLHLWLSVVFGLIIALICLTGLILLFEPSHAPGGGRSEFFLDVMRLHRWLFDVPAEKGAMSAGKLIIGISTVSMILNLISGIILWSYETRGGLRRSLSIPVTKGWAVFLRKLHSAGGMYVVIFLLIMAFTGLTWSFGWYRQGFNFLFGIEKGSHIVYMIHSGRIGGIATKILWFLASLIGFTLPLTGYWLWIRRLTKKNSKS